MRFAEFPGPVALVLACGLGAVLLLLSLRTRIRDTTLTAAWWWAIAAAIGVTTAETLIAWPGASLGTHAASSVRWIAAALTFCPTMAVLGAKRPQHQAWHFVVLAMWGIVALPALENLVLHPGQAMEIHGVRAAFLLGMIGLGVLNWLPTRRWPVALLVGLGQMLLYAEWLWPVSAVPRYAGQAAGIVFAAALGVAGALPWVTQTTSVTVGWDRVWRDFRDDFGALWAVRVAERINAAATIGDWPLRLRWDGFHKQPDDGGSKDAALASSLASGLQTTLENLLRRFVSPHWIAKRGVKDVH